MTATEETIAMPSAPPRPARIGHYEIRELLGEGAMGRVYLAHDPAIDRPVALKVIHAHLLTDGQDTEILERFRREARAAGRLSHPNIVAVYEYGEENRQPFIAMEYVAGESLKDRLAGGYRFTPAEVRALMGQLLDALACAHRQGVVHRDIKPANILLLPDGRIKITDFGIAHLEDSQLTRTGMLVGSPAYMAPEQCMGLPVDPRADLFSAGVVLYELLTGERPFAGQQGTAVIQRIMTAEPDPPSRLNPLLPRRLDQVVLKVLAKKPEARYADATAMKRALDTALQAGTGREKSGNRRLRRWGWAVLIALLVVLVLVGYDEFVRRTPSQSLSVVPSKAGAIGHLVVHSEPEGALVLLDGDRFLGVTPFQLALPAGPQRLTVRKFGFQPLEVTVEIPIQGTLPLDLVLMEENP